jgi:toxin ParE1/3/4
VSLMARVIQSEQAQADLEEILDYRDSQSSQAADRFAVKFEQSCELHAKYPQTGASAEEYAPNLRHFTVWNYAVFDRPVDDGIELIRMIQGARDTPKLFE